MNNTQKVLKNQHICEQATPNLGITQSSGLDKHDTAARNNARIRFFFTLNTSLESGKGNACAFPCAKGD